MRRLNAGLFGFTFVTAAAVVALVLSTGTRDGNPHDGGVALKRSPSTALASLRQPAASPPSASKGAGNRIAGRLDGVGALAVLRSSFPDYATRPAWPDLARQRAVEIQRYAGTHTAVVKTNGVTALAQSMLPLRVRDRDGRLSPTDTALRPEGRRLAPRNTPSRYSLPDRVTSSGSIASFPAAGFGLRTDVDAGAAAPAMRDGRQVTASVRQDQDLVLTPMPTGLDVAWQLRTKNASGRLSLQVPGADRLEVETRAGVRAGARIIRHGQGVGRVLAPAAVDAAGKPVNVSWDVEGDTMRLDVDVTAPRVTAPVLVDPFVTDDQRYWVSNTNLDFNGWVSSGDPSFIARFSGNSIFGNGLYLGRIANRSVTVPAGLAGDWSFKARQVAGTFAGEGGRIFKADFGNRADAVSGTSNACWSEGIRANTGAYNSARVRLGVPPNGNLNDPANYLSSPLLLCQNEGTAGQPLTYPYRVHCMTICDLTGGGLGASTPGNAVALGILARQGTSSGAFVFMGSSLIFQTETFGPHNQLTGLPPGGGWVDDIPISAQADDYGMGMAAISATAPGTAWGGSTAPTPTCITSTPNPPEGGTAGSPNQGDRNRPCSQTMSTAFRTATMPEGAYNVHIRSADIVQNPADTDTPVKVDHNAPVLTLTGALKNDDGSYARNGDSVQVSATDAYSGARTLTVKLDGQNITGSPATCSVDGCATSLDYALDTSQVREGTHTLTVDASDLLGHAAPTQRVTFKVDTTEPIVNLGGDLAGADGAIVTGDSYQVEATPQDSSSRQGQPSGIRTITVRVDPDTAPADADHLATYTNAACQQNSCPMTFTPATPFTYTTSKYGDGAHTVQVTAEDAVGNTDVDILSFTVAHAAQLPSQTLNATDSQPVVDGANVGDRLGASTADVGDINGDGRDDLLVGAPGVDAPGQTDAGAAYLIYGSDSTAPVSLSDVSRVVQLTYNQAGGNAGAAVSAGGDINGDGQLDLLIGAPGSSTLGLPAVQGRVWAVFGGSDLPQTVDLSALGTRGIQIKGPALSGGVIPPLLSPSATSTFGSQLASRRLGDYEVEGDINGDGRDDIVIGSGNATTPNLTGGVAYVIFGRDTTGTIDLGPTNGDPGAGGFRIYGAKSVLNLLSPGQAGTATTIIGDVDGDGLAELAVTDPGMDPSGRGSAGTAYVVFGRNATSPVDLANLGSGGYAIQGGSGDAIATAASPGDIDGDGQGDLLLGGHGGFVVFSKTDTTSVDLAGSFAGYRMDAPSGTGFERASVAGAGDQDGDEAADVIVGFPNADSNRGIAYLVYGKLGTTAIDLGTLRGDQGARLDGIAASRAASASDGTDNTDPGGDTATMVSAPDTNAKSGQLRRFSGARLAARNATDKNFCALASPVPTFPFAGNTRPLPFCRRALHGTIDIGLGSNRNGKKLFNPSPRCGIYALGRRGHRCLPTAFRNGNARVKKPLIGEDVTPGLPDHPQNLVPVYDTFGPPGTDPRSAPKPYGYIEQGSYPGCFNVYNGAQQLIGSTDPQTATSKCGAQSTGQPLALMEYQGRGCMPKRNIEGGYVLMGIVQAPPPKTAPPDYPSSVTTGLRGFIPLQAVPVDTSVTTAQRTSDPKVPVPVNTPTVDGGLTYNQFKLLQKAYPGCGKASPRLKPLSVSDRAPADDQLHAADNFITQPDSNSPFPFLDQYLNRTTLSRGCQGNLDPAIRRSRCTGFYANNQGPCYSPNVAAMLISSNYVSASGSSSSQNPSSAGAGGVARGWVRRDAGAGTFQPYDKMPYADDNIPGELKATLPLGTRGIATYVFGNFNPGAGEVRAQALQRDPNTSADDLEQDMFAWTAIRRPQVAGPARYTC